jgi:predicted ATPase
MGPRNFALVGDERVQLGPGLCVVTGESGAGKSVLVGALAQLLGAPAADTAIRAPAAAASVEGRLHLPHAALVRAAVVMPCFRKVRALGEGRRADAGLCDQPGPAAGCTGWVQAG